MIPKDQRDEDKAVCEATTPGPWVVDAEESILWQGGPDGAAIGDTEEMADAVFIATARDRLPAYIDALDELERRIAAVEARIETIDEPGAAHGLAEALRILRGEK